MFSDTLHEGQGSGGRPHSEQEGVQTIFFQSGESPERKTSRRPGCERSEGVEAGKNSRKKRKGAFIVNSRDRSNRKDGSVKTHQKKKMNVPDKDNWSKRPGKNDVAYTERGGRSVGMRPSQYISRKNIGGESTLLVALPREIHEIKSLLFRSRPVPSSRTRLQRPFIARALSRGILRRGGGAQKYSNQMHRYQRVL